MATDRKLDEVIFQLLQFRRSNPTATREFAGLPHNAGVLPLLQAKLEQIVSAFMKYRKIVYDIQGIRDSGTDLLFKQTNDEDDFICFQVKTEEDLRKSDYLKTIKAQYFDSKQRFAPISDYYVFLCCDVSQSVIAEGKRRTTTNRDLVRNVAAELSTEKGLHVIEPPYAHAFLRMATMQIDAVIKAEVGEEDIVVKSATELVADLTPTELALVVSMVHRNLLSGEDPLTADDLISDEFLRDCYSSVPDWERSHFFTIDDWVPMFEEDEQDEAFRERLSTALKDASGRSWADIIEDPDADPLRGMDLRARLTEDLDYLEDNFLSCSAEGRYYLERGGVAAIAALMADGQVRYDYEGKDLDWYVWSVLSPEYAARSGITDAEDWSL